MNPFYEIQSSIEGVAAAAIDNTKVKVLSRRKGDTKNEVDAELSKIGVAVIVSAPLPIEYGTGGGNALYIDKVRIGLQIIENVGLNKTAPKAFELLTLLTKKFHNERITLSDGQIITFVLLPVEDKSPEDTAHVILFQPMEFALTI